MLSFVIYNMYLGKIMSVSDLFNFDRQFNRPIIGTDEAGRGPAAGGVYAAAVNFDGKITAGLLKDLEILNDSKKLTPKKRESIYDCILKNTLNKIVCIEVDEIEKINILNASLKAMNIACTSIMQDNVLTLVDGNKLIPDLKLPQRYVIKGDGTSASIAAASILAQVERDRYLIDLSKEFPQYGWDKNMGYLTKEHLDAIDKYGTTPYHRMSYLKKHFEKQLSLF
jgi:ribonuclease HII